MVSSSFKQCINSNHTPLGLRILVGFLGLPLSRLRTYSGTVGSRDTERTLLAMKLARVALIDHLIHGTSALPLDARVTTRPSPVREGES